MDYISVRCPDDKDDLLKISLCIYLTDPFIYPAAFGANIQDASIAISKLMCIKNGLFNINNFVIALYREEICGILLYNEVGAVWNTNECVDMVDKYVPSIENFRYVSENYFSMEAIAPAENYIEVIACSVLPEFQNMGVGRNLISWMVEAYPGHTLTLDVLANNPAAIKLYKKCGFKIRGKFKGFSLEDSFRPVCYHMVREPDYIRGKE